MKSQNVPYEGFSKVDVMGYSCFPWKPPLEISRKIEEKWKSLEKGKSGVYNGQMVRVYRMQQEGETLNLYLQRTNYKSHLGTISEMPLENRANALFAAANMITSDDKLVLGEVTGGLYAGRINICAGSVNPDLDKENGLPSVEKAMLREAGEELFLDRGDFTRLAPRYVLIEETKPHPSIMHIGRLSLDSQELELKFNNGVYKTKSRGIKPELGKLHFVKPTEKGISDYLDRYSDKILGRVSIILNDLLENPQRLEL